MKKKKIIILAALAVVLLLVLFVPFSVTNYDDGGTVEYRALTYRVINWHFYLGPAEDPCRVERVYFGADVFADFEELRKTEMEKVERRIRAIVVSLNDDNAVVAPLGDVTYFRYKSGLIISLDALEEINAKEGSVIDIIFTGSISPDDPQITTVKECLPAMSENDSKCKFSGVDREYCEIVEGSEFSDLVITRVYSDCFFAQSASLDASYSVKVIGTLPDGFSIGDNINLTFDTAYYDKLTKLYELDMKDISINK